jgi:hypothetical protein
LDVLPSVTVNGDGAGDAGSNLTAGKAAVHVAFMAVTAAVVVAQGVALVVPYGCAYAVQCEPGGGDGFAATPANATANFNTATIAERTKETPLGNRQLT